MTAEGLWDLIVYLRQLRSYHLASDYLTREPLIRSIVPMMRRAVAARLEILRPASTGVTHRRRLADYALSRLLGRNEQILYISWDAPWEPSFAYSGYSRRVMRDIITLHGGVFARLPLRYAVTSFFVTQQPYNVGTSKPTPVELLRERIWNEMELSHDERVLLLGMW